jgi:hypothetical protein
MKDQRNKQTSVRSGDGSDKSLQTQYHELLELREEVKDAEQRSSQKMSKGEKPATKTESEI